MAKVQDIEWAEAQKIAVSVDLVEAAKNQLKFLAAVDRNRFLYEDHALDRAIYRYNACWLPLLAKHLENPVFEGPLVVPLDCEWIWHCHRLNPMIYKFDCEKLFGRILGNHQVISSIQATSKSKTEELWNTMYPEEPYEFDLHRPFSQNILQQSQETGTSTSYDLLSAVKRQISFAFQVSRPHMSDDLFLQEAVARYKGFLHLIKKNQKLRQNQLCVPTYDIDLIWHTHQLHPDFYYKDMNELVGILVEHNDNISDATKKLKDGHSKTTRQWEQTFGRSYWKAGAMFRGDIPTPVTLSPSEFNLKGKEFNALKKCGKQIQFATVKAMEVLLEFVDIKNLPVEHNGNLVVAFSKSQPDILFNTKRLLGISSDSKEKKFALFQCEPIGEFVFELISYSPCSDELELKKSMKLLGSCSLSLEDLVSRPQLSANKWVSVNLVSGITNSEPVLLRVSISFTPPTPAPQTLQLVQSKSPKDDQIQTRVMDANGKELLSLHKRNTVKDAIKCTSDLVAEVDYITASGEKHALVEFNGVYWSIKGTQGSFKLQNSPENDNSLLLVGYKMVKFFPGRRLDFEPMHNKTEKLEQDFVTAVEFSTDYPYGKAVALINSKSKTIKAIDEWIVLPSIALAFILSDFSSNYEIGICKAELKTTNFRLKPCIHNTNGICSTCIANNHEYGSGGGLQYIDNSTCMWCTPCGTPCGSLAGVNDGPQYIDNPTCMWCTPCGSRPGFTDMP